jgi:hypothetical protein
MRYRLLAVLAFGVVMFAGGWYLGRGTTTASAPAIPAVPAQAAPPLQEIIPFPGPGQQGPGQRPGQQGAEECEPVILFYFQGRLFRLMPGPGPQGPQGTPGSPPEYFPLQPYQGPAIPGLPFQLPPGGVPQLPPGAVPQPQGPGFTPLQPRF